MNNQYLISVCIPSFNRPEELRRLIESIECKNKNTIEIVICEDKSPKREEIRNIVNEFKKEKFYDIKYIENQKNLGFDKNLRELVKNADGEYIIFMGDDDIFIPEALDKYIDFLAQNKGLGYILRSYRNQYADGSIEYFKYYKSNKFFGAGVQTYIELFGKSVFISGFTIKNKYIKDLATDEFDGTLLYQLYLLAEVCIKYPSAYFSIPITQAFEEGIPYFGSSENEKDLYTPGNVTIQNSLNFMRSYLKVIDNIDKKHNIKSTKPLMTSMSKYSYPVLSIQRDKGLKQFMEYSSSLRDLGFDCTFYFEIYFWSLLIFGRKFNDNFIRLIKKILGRRPNL